MMTCTQCQQLFDAYLDGQLTGSLRLEFDAHRLRCRRCQQTLAMLEAVGHVITADEQLPDLSDDFTYRVMERIESPPKRIFRFPRARVAVVAAALVQAAAVLTFAIVWHRQPATPLPQATPADWTSSQWDSVEDDPAFQTVRAVVASQVEQRIWDTVLAGKQLRSDVTGLAAYLNISLPADVARESVKVAGTNPLQVFFDSLLPSEDEETHHAPPRDDIHSI